MKKNRNISLDVIRCVALTCVIAVHFFLNTGFYQESVAGCQMFVMILMRSSFMICVPLFMLLTGYLVHNAEISIKYYVKIVRILFVYILASFFCAICSVYILRSGISFPGAIVNILSFGTIPYSWYIEMYIGIFLLIPFLNKLYANLSDKNEKRALLLVLLFLTAAPSALNIYRVAGIGWWAVPSSNPVGQPVIPDWWETIYPITYFFVGRYLHEYQCRLSIKRNVLIVILTFGFAGIFNYYRSYGSEFVWGPWQEYGSALVTAQSISVFCLLLKINYDKLPATFKHMISTVSDLSLGAYLVSWVFDQIVYTELNKSGLSMAQKLKWFPVCVLSVLVGSVLISYIIHVLYTISCKKIVENIMNKRSEISS